MEFYDQIGHKFILEAIPRRIVSLVPSQTEFLFDIGLDNEIVGITNFCVHPKEKVARSVKVGGTKNFSIDKIKMLNPDLIIANKEENTKEGINMLQHSFPVYTSDINTLNDSLAMMTDIGRICNQVEQAKLITNKIAESFVDLSSSEKSWRTLYLIWRKPYMSIGVDTFIHQMMMNGGFDNVLTNANRYPELRTEEISALQPELILLSSEPYPFKQRHKEELQLICPKAEIIFVDGEMFSWYGSRLQYTTDYLIKLREAITN